MSQATRQSKNRSERIYGAYDRIDPLDMISRKEKLASSLPEKYRDSIYFEIDSESFPYDPNEYYGVFMFWKDDETDAEMNERLDQEAKIRQQQEDRERKEFERLRKKFSNS